MRRSNQLQEQILSTVATAVFTVDVNRHITGINTEFTRITGFTESDAIGTPCNLLAGEPWRSLVAFLIRSAWSPSIGSSAGLGPRTGGR